jgi:hypothetical protein
LLLLLQLVLPPVLPVWFVLLRLLLLVLQLPLLLLLTLTPDLLLEGTHGKYPG